MVDAKNNNTQIRSSNFELLRIIAMLMIVFGHMAGQAFDNANVCFSGRVFEIFFCSGSRVSVNLFLMIGVYFLVDSSFKAERLLKMWGGVWFYSVTITLLLMILGFQLSTKDIISSFVPFLRRWMWFVPLYMVLIVISPFLKRLVNHLSKDEWRLLVIIGFLFVSGMSSLSKDLDSYFCALAWFIYVYFVIGYYKKYVAQKIKKTNLLLLVGIAIYLLMTGVLFLCEITDNRIVFLIGKISGEYLGNYKSIPNFLCSLCVFIYFSSLNIKKSIVINESAKNTLDVYMIHQHVAFIPILWGSVCQSKVWENSPYFILIFVVVAFLLFACFSIIGRIRVRLIEPLWVNSSLFKKTSDFVNKYYESISKN